MLARLIPPISPDAGPTRRWRPLLATLLCAALVSVGPLARRAAAQAGLGSRTVPRGSYYLGIQTLYGGDYRQAARQFESGLRGGIKTTQSRWIDSICYYTMLGESYYHTGQNTQALKQYDAALNLYLQFSDWMIRVKFPVKIAPDQGRARRATPWGRSSRNFTLGRFPNTMLIGQGQVLTEQRLLRGGVIQQPILFPVNVQEIVRCTALAIRRRSELMGPVCPISELTRGLLAALSRRPGPPNHWSEAWIDLQLGLAYVSAGKPEQAVTYLRRSLVVAGQYDHPLTCVGMLELGRLALEAGDFDTAGKMFEEAVYSAYYFDNVGVITEALRYAQLVHLLANRGGVYAPLGVGIRWAQKERLRHVQVWLGALSAENFTSLGQPQAALTMLKDARVAMGRRGMATGVVVARLNYLTAMALYQQNQPQQASEALSAALLQQQTASKRLFQISLVDFYYAHPDGPLIDPRKAMELYQVVLRDSSAFDWSIDPFEELSVLTTPHGASFENWFGAALRQNKIDMAVEIADRARRHRFHVTLPLGGRLMALRWILESRAADLPAGAAMARQELMVRYPNYDALAQQAAAIRAELARKPLFAEDDEKQRAKTSRMVELARLSADREAILREVALNREPGAVAFPPLRSFQELQTRLPAGHALLVFFASAGELYGFVLTNGDYTHWKVESPIALRRNIVALLRALGNNDANREISADDLAGETWKTAAREVYQSIFRGSRVDLTKDVEHLVIVPDNILWYLPFEALIAGEGENAAPLISGVRIRYAPTAGLAVADDSPARRTSTTGIVIGKLFPRDEPEVAEAAFERMRGVVPGATPLRELLPVPSPVVGSLLDGLIVLDDIEASTPYGWSPIPLDRNRAVGSLAEWIPLPWGGPRWMVLPGFHTAAETSLRSRGGAPNGNEVFLAICGMMTRGTRTILLSRWRTGGQTSFDLVREFVQELPHTLASDAWHRSVQLAKTRAIDSDREPRVERLVGDQPPTASHPFFWAGYLLVDSGKPPPEADAPGLRLEPEVKLNEPVTDVGKPPAEK